jgi:hypothetical protein
MRWHAPHLGHPPKRSLVEIAIAVPIPHHHTSRRFLAVSYKYNDERRQEMAAMGFLVRVINVDRRTHKITAVWYTFDPRSEEERDRAYAAEAEEAYAKKASDESLT